MEDFLGLIFLVIVFVLGPILEQIRRKQGPPQQRRPLPRPPGEEWRPPLPSQKQEQQSRTEEVRASTEYQQARSREESESAATMVPEDLWAVLTGQPLPPRQQPRPLPAPEEESELESLEGEERIPREDTVEIRRRPFEESFTLEEAPRREYPVVVSMEEELPDARTRHAAFHQRFQPAPPLAAPRVTRAARYLQKPSDLRLAMIYKMILGPPKALE
jgi:hypothetical protein